MESIYILIPVSFIFLAIAAALWFWSVGNGQFDDLDKAANSILFDDDLEPVAKKAASEDAQSSDTPQSGDVSKSPNDK